MVVPVFTHLQHSGYDLIVMLTFSIGDDDNLPDWCLDLSSVLKKHQVSATVFFSGRVADQYPECVKAFEKNIDIGSQTYNFVDLTSIPDYSSQLEEIREGKEAVDEAGLLSSRLFKAPFGLTDENIYSLLNRSSIIADFSYDRQYNKYHDGQFIRFDLVTYDGAAYSTDFLASINTTKTPVLINYDNNNSSIEKIDELIFKLKKDNIDFVNASELTGLILTVREVE